MFLGRIYLLIFALLAQLGLSGCYTKQSNTQCAYTVGTLYIDNGERYSIKSEAACKEICDASSECVAFGYVHKGQHSGGPMKLGTGTCYYYGGTEYSTAVDHDRSCFVKKDCDAETELVCDWVSGDGQGNGEEKISSTITGTECVKACYKKGGFNGATIKANGANGCWCERNMNRVKTSSSYKTCYIKPKGLTCDYISGDGTGRGEVKIEDQISGEACAIECHRLGGYNGATILSSGDCTFSSKGGCGCWCEKGMNAIRSSSTTYKTCYIRTESSGEMERAVGNSQCDHINDDNKSYKCNGYYKRIVKCDICQDDNAGAIDNSAINDAIRNPAAEQTLSLNALAETANPKLIEIVTYVFAAIGFLSMLYVGVKHGSKAFSQGDYAEV